MNTSRIATCIFLLATFSTAWSQDQAIDAKDEPHHRPKFVNEVVRVLDVEVLPGEATQYHTHSRDYPYVMLSTTLLKNDIPGKPQADLKIVSGLVGYYRASQGAYTHRFTNIDSTVFRAIGIELLGDKPLGVGAEPLTEDTKLKKVLDNERVRGYRLTLPPGELIGPLVLPGRSVRVVQTSGTLKQSIDGAEPNSNTVALGQFEWRQTAATYIFRNVGDTPIELVEFEFK